MNSFIESGEMVIFTSWDEVEEEKPPEGLEHDSTSVEYYTKAQGLSMNRSVEPGY